MPLTVQPVRVGRAGIGHAAAAVDGGVAAHGAVGRVGRAEIGQAAGRVLGGVAADGAAGQVDCAGILQAAAEELPLKVQSIRLAVPSFARPPVATAVVVADGAVRHGQVGPGGIEHAAGAFEVDEGVVAAKVQPVSVAVP